MADETGLAARLRQALTEKKISKSTLARALEVSPAAVSKWLKTGTIARKYIPQIASLLNVSADWLLTGGASATAGAPLAATFSLTAAECEILELIRWLTPEQQADLLRHLQAIQQQNQRILDALRNRH